MKWLYSVVFAGFILGQSSGAVAGHVEAAIEEKLTSLEVESGIKTPPEKTSFNVFGDFLLWKTSLDGVAWSTTAELVPGIAGGDVFDDYKTRTVHFDYDPAFQIGAGVGLPYDHWDIAVRWLRSYSTGRDHAHGVKLPVIGNRVILDSIGMIQGIFNPLFAQTATAKCRVHLNLVDLVVARTFLWSKYFSFRPFAGIRGVWLNMDWDIDFNMPIQPNFAFDQTFTDLDVDNRYHAGGLVG